MTAAAHTDWTEIAARNNADWCVTVWRSHGLPVRRVPGMVFCPAPTPTFYPNAVTVSRDADPRALAEFIGELSDMADLPEFSVKDSFAALDLATQGFEPLFDAQWIHGTPRPPFRKPDLRWDVVRTDAALSAWEHAWNAFNPAGERIFRPSLLGDPRIRLAGGMDGDNVMRAGGIGYEAAGAVGLGNVFGDVADFLRMAPVIYSRTSNLVGYERGDALKEMEYHGFSAIGPLRVWTAQRLTAKA